MTDKLMTEVAKTFTTSLDNTLKNAISPDRNTQCVNSFSGKNVYEHESMAVINDPKLNWNEKSDYLERASTNYSERVKVAKDAVIEIQNALTKNTIIVTVCCLGGFFLEACVAICVFTPGGRKFAGTCIKKLMS